jgi:hypothetical protein
MTSSGIEPGTSPACSTVPQPTTLQRDEFDIYVTELITTFADRHRQIKYVFGLQVHLLLQYALTRCY